MGESESRGEASLGWVVYGLFDIWKRFTNGS